PGAGSPAQARVSSAAARILALTGNRLAPLPTRQPLAYNPIQFEAEYTLRDQIRARAEHPETAEKPFLFQHKRSWTFGQFRDESTRAAHFLLRLLGAGDDKRHGHVAMLLENHLELLSLYGGCGIAGLTLFG